MNKPLSRLMRFDERGRCVASGKRPYKDKLTALVVNADKPLMARAYECPYCLRWHLTRSST